MNVLILLFFLLLNAMWAFVAFTLRAGPAEPLTVFGWETTFLPYTYVPHAVISVIVIQIILVSWLYYVRSKAQSLRTHYKKEKGDRKELEQTVSEQAKKLQNSSSIEEKASILEERTSGLEALSNELKHQNDVLLGENAELLRQVQSLTGTSSSLLSTIRNKLGL